MEQAKKIQINAYGFCLRDKEGNLVYAEAHNLGVGTNMEEENMAIVKALSYCFA